MILMLIIFIMELFFSIVPNFTGTITLLVAKLFIRIPNEELTVRRQVKEMKAEQIGLSVTDDFVKYSLIQRKVDKLMAQIKLNMTERKKKMTYLRMAVSAGLYIFHGLITVSLVFSAHEPVMMLDTAWLSPMTKFVSFPTGEPGGVGLGFWIICCNAVIRRVKTVVNSLPHSTKKLQQLPLD